MSATPMAKQYHELKRKSSDAILFFQVGDFYETFEEDAKLVSRELGIVLTFKDKDKTLHMAGVPIKGAGPYINRLVRRGYKVAICNQMEKPSPKKKLVRREIVRIITPGTVFETDLLDDTTNNYLAALVPGQKAGYGLAFVDLSTGLFQTCHLTGKTAFNDLIMEFTRNPRECILPRSISENQDIMDTLREEISNIYFAL